MKKIEITELKNGKILIVSEYQGIKWVEKFNKRDKIDILQHLDYQIGRSMNCFVPYTIHDIFG